MSAGKLLLLMTVALIGSVALLRATWPDFDLEDVNLQPETAQYSPALENALRDADAYRMAFDSVDAELRSCERRAP